MGTLVPRVVVVTRPSALERLLSRHGTVQQARFVLAGRGQTLDEVVAWHGHFTRALDLVRGAIPRSWRRARVDRSELDRFLFEPEDVVVAVGQDGLVANVAKYLDGQPVIGVNPDGYRIAVREDVLREVDGPMLRHGIQEMEGRKLWVPRSAAKKPDLEALAVQWQRFRDVG